MGESEREKVLDVEPARDGKFLAAVTAAENNPDRMSKAEKGTSETPERRERDRKFCRLFVAPLRLCLCGLERFWRLKKRDCRLDIDTQRERICVAQCLR